MSQTHRASVSVLSALVLPYACALQPAAIAFERRMVKFPRNILTQFFQNPQPGTRIDSPSFEVSGSRFRVELYPCGGNADPDYSSRVGLYLRWLPPGDDDAAGPTEVDTTFALSLQTLPAAAPANGTVADGEELGWKFQCGMTFCNFNEAGETTGRCEDWGAHIYETAGLCNAVFEEEREVGVEVELSVWAQRQCRSGAALQALGEQVQRLPRGEVRVGEVVELIAKH